MQALITASDLQMAGQEPRIFDLRLAEALGFDRPRKIRELVARWKAALERFGEVSPHRGAKPSKGSTGGRPEEGYLLNEEQALFLCTKSETERATEVTIQMVRVFREWRAGGVAAAEAHTDALLEEPPALRQAALRAELNYRIAARRLAAVDAERAAWRALRSRAEPKLASPPPAASPQENWVRIGDQLVRIDVNDWMIVTGRALVATRNGGAMIAELVLGDMGMPAWAELGRPLQRVGYTILDGHAEKVTILGRILEERPA